MRDELDNVAFARGQLVPVGVAPGPAGPADAELFELGLDIRHIGPSAKVNEGGACGLELDDGFAAGVCPDQATGTSGPYERSVVGVFRKISPQSTAMRGMT